MKQISQPHCQSCGRSGAEMEASGSYSGCCNELIIGGFGEECASHAEGGDCFHK